MIRAGAVTVAALALVAPGRAAAPAVPPAPGHHAAELCVATSAAPPNCGPAQADLYVDGTLSVRVDDVVYHLALRSTQVEVVLTHNTVQIDEFSAPYTWAGNALTFVDDERHARYEIRFPELSAAPR